MFQLDPNVFGSIMSKTDYDRQKQMLFYQRQQKRLQQPEMLDTQQLLAKAIQLGGAENLSPQEQAQLQAADIAQRTKQSVDPRGNIITNRSYYDLLGGKPSDVLGQPPVTPPIAPMPQGMPAQLPVDGLPKVQIDESQLEGLSPYSVEDVKKEAAKKQIEMQAKQVEQEAQSSKAREGVTQTVGDMVDQYKKLQRLGGITSTSKSPLENIAISATETNPLAQSVQKAAGSETQTSRQVIEASRARLMQEIKKATGMSAQEVNSIPEMQLLKESISDPTMTVEAVQQILGNIESKYGLGKGVNITAGAGKRMKYNPATGMLE